jgi:threonine/homoserine/homoserine lactone efflux protein
LYLIYLGVRIWKGAQHSLIDATADQAARSTAAARSFAIGLTTQISNPKAAIVYASVFAAFLPANVTLSFDIAVASIVFSIEAGWYSLVAFALSSSGPRAAYLRVKAWVDRAAGTLMVALGLKLLLSAHRN